MMSIHDTDQFSIHVVGKYKTLCLYNNMYWGLHLPEMFSYKYAYTRKPGYKLPQNCSSEKHKNVQLACRQLYCNVQVFITHICV